MQDVVLAALVPVVDAHLHHFVHFLKGKNTWLKNEDGCDLQDLRIYQEEHEEENTAEPWGDKPRTVADTFHH